MRFKRWANLAGRSAALLLASAVRTVGCPLCQTSIASGETAAETAQTINSAVLVLLVPVVVIIGGLARLVFKYRNYQAHSYVDRRPSDPERNSQ